MKKLLVLCLTVVLVLCMSFSAFAAGFVESPSNNSAPTIVEFENEDEDCTAQLVITPYNERHDLSPELREKIEEAYDIIKNSTDLTKLNADLKSHCSKNNIDPKNIAVSDLFDIDYEHCTVHETHAGFVITLKSSNFKNFVALLHYKDGEFENVKLKSYSNDGTTIKFVVEDLSPFAVVVETESGEGSPVTGDNSNIVLWTVVLAVSVIALGVTLFFITKKKKA